MKLLVALFVALSISSCQPELEDISNQMPYKTAVGKKFVLQRDLYIIQFLDGSGFTLGSHQQFPAGSGIPERIDSGYVGLEVRNLKIVGIAKQGDIFKIIKVIKTKDHYFRSADYCIALDPNRFEIKKPIFTFPILNYEYNPPKTVTWSTPPIFKEAMAIPVVTDGVWWRSTDNHSN